MVPLLERVASEGLADLVLLDYVLDDSAPAPRASGRCSGPGSLSDELCSEQGPLCSGVRAAGNRRTDEWETAGECLQLQHTWEPTAGVQVGVRLPLHVIVLPGFDLVWDTQLLENQDHLPRKIA